MSQKRLGLRAALPPQLLHYNTCEPCQARWPGADVNEPGITSMRILLLSTGLLLSVSVAAFAQDNRELGPHVHGAGTLKIAVEGNKVLMDFSAPANDIVGFEHQPTTPEQKQALAAATESLKKPFALFGLPGEAGCTLASVEVLFHAAEPAAAGAPAKPAAAGAAQSGHGDFDVDYELNCSAPAKITSMTFPYFQRFAGAQKLTVTLLSGSGADEFEVSRENPSFALK